jgi:MFS transporter, DHA1 family, solute carrier family 18 (vesicular amine transporter), member 1/2
VFGAAALASSVLHPLYGNLSDRWGGGRLMVAGLVLSGLALPLLNAAKGPISAAATMVVVWAALGLIVTPSLAFMAEALSAAGLESYGVAYGLYNVAWAVGLMGGPSLGGVLLQTAGFGPLTLGWAAALIAAGAVLARPRP